MTQRQEAIIIAPAWPGTTGGMEIAIRSDITAYHTYFKRIHLLVLSEKIPGERWEEEFPLINWCHIHICKKPLWNRFLRSLLHQNPSITLQFSELHRRVESAMRRFRRELEMTAPPAVIFVSMPPSVLIPLARAIFPGSPIISHSHNVNSRAFIGLPRRGPLFSRLAWGYELARIRRYERWVAAAADKFWAISQYDRGDYSRLLGIEVDGVMGAYLDVDRFANLPEGDPETIVHVGRIDLRKGRGMARFIKQVWPAIRQARPSAQLVLGGAGTEEFDNSAEGIRGLGFVDDELAVLRQGMIFINPQMDGSGIQLKSIVAMLSGRLLVTSVTGGEGVAGQHPLHFYAENDPDRLARIIIEAINNPPAARETALRGQSIARETYNKRHFLQEAHALLNKSLGVPA